MSNSLYPNQVYKGTTCNAFPTYATPNNYGCNVNMPITNPTPVSVTPTLFKVLRPNPNTPLPFVVNPTVLPPKNSNVTISFPNRYKTLNEYSCT